MRKSLVGSGSTINLQVRKADPVPAGLDCSNLKSGDRVHLPYLQIFYWCKFSTGANILLVQIFCWRKYSIGADILRVQTFYGFLISRPVFLSTATIRPGSPSS